MNRSVAQTEIRADDRTLRTLAVGNLKGVGGDYLITVGNCIKIVGKIILIIKRNLCPLHPALMYADLYQLVEYLGYAFF